MGISTGWMAIQGDTIDVWLKSETFVSKVAEALGVELTDVNQEMAIDFIRSEEGMNEISPYYDSGSNERVFGIKIQGTYDWYSEVDPSGWEAQSEAATERLKVEFGFAESKLYVGADVN